MKYALKPFQPHSSQPAQPELSVEISRSGKNRLSLRYELTGNLDSIQFPPPVPSPSRKDRLWEMTCFEAFLGLPGNPSYWEMNFSPSGDWNCYHFTRYREGMKEAPGLEKIPIETHRENNRFHLTVDFPLDSLGIAPATLIEVGLSAVIQQPAPASPYWALEHVGEKPDFHLRKSFLLRL